MSSMFCFQCEQAAQATGCTAMGVCGKAPETAALQDLLIHAVKGISSYAFAAAEKGRRSDAIDLFTIDALFTTVTNVNFDPKRMQEWLMEAAHVKQQAMELYSAACREDGSEAKRFSGACNWEPAEDLDELIRQGESVGVETRIRFLGHDINSLQEILVYGIKGTAAYAHHAWHLGKSDASIAAYFYKALAYLAEEKPSADKLLELNMECGQINLKVMELLDAGHNKQMGTPEPTEVRIDPIPGKCILVSGHDMVDLKALLEQTEGKGIHVYTHGEMLPAHSYPVLKRFKHLVGNYGGAWQDQAKEFDAFPGAIVMTTNCIQKPKQSYIKRIFTCGPVAWPEVNHVKKRDFSNVIKSALEQPGFSERGEGKMITLGFGHSAVLGVADKVIDAVKSGAIRHFYVVGGCDGAKSGRNYYTEFAEKAPKNTVILTLGCGKYRFNKLEFGSIGGIPRLLDLGQCNDAYSAIKIALALSEAFGCGVNELPLTLNISWYEQKAVAVLLTLLSLGIRNIRLGPTLPAFISPGVLGILQEKFGIRGIRTAEEDIAESLAG